MWRSSWANGTLFPQTGKCESHTCGTVSAHTVPYTHTLLIQMIKSQLSIFQWKMCVSQVNCRKWFRTDFWLHMNVCVCEFFCVLFDVLVYCCLIEKFPALVAFAWNVQSILPRLYNIYINVLSIASSITFELRARGGRSVGLSISSVFFHFIWSLYHQSATENTNRWKKFAVSKYHKAKLTLHR